MPVLLDLGQMYQQVPKYKCGSRTIMTIGNYKPEVI